MGRIEVDPVLKLRLCRSFKQKMKEYNIPDNYVLFKTNALHGLLSQVSVRGEVPNDLQLTAHMKAYKDSLPLYYGNDDKKALHDKRIPELQRVVLDYVNGRIRETNLRSAITNTQQNLIQPLLHHLSQRKLSDEQLVLGELTNEQQGKFVQELNPNIGDVSRKLAKHFKSLRDEVAVARGQKFADDEDRISKRLREQMRTEKRRMPTKCTNRLLLTKG